MPRSRQIALIGFPSLKNARRIFAIVSTTSIPTSASKNHGSRCCPSVRGSLLDADHPQRGSFLHADSHHVRVGLEDAPLGAPASTTNLRLVEDAVRIVRHH